MSHNGGGTAFGAFLEAMYNADHRRRLAKRAVEIHEELTISEKVGVYKPISKCTVWMDKDYKMELEEILQIFYEQNK
jgi:hypothetical protein